jgi:hypothetical protein
MLSRMIREAVFPVGTELPVFRVGFQQRNAGYPLDDFVAHARPRGPGGQSSAPRIQFQVKRAIRLQREDAEFRKVIAAAVQACQGHPQDMLDGRLLLGLAAGEPAAGLTDLGRLADMARAEDDIDSFRCQFRKGVTSERLRNLRETVTAVAASVAATDSATEADDLTFRILDRLHVWQPQVDDDGSDWRAELSGVADIAAGAGLEAADLLGHLYGLACFYDRHGGTISAARVRQRLLSDHGLDIPLPGQGDGRPATGNIVHVYGNGPTWVGGTQVFPNLRFGSD